MKNTPAVPAKARASAWASPISATATSQPSAAQGAPRAASRTTARTGRPAASSVRATSPPTLPVIPVTAYIVLSSGSLNIGFATAIEPARLGGAGSMRLLAA